MPKKKPRVQPVESSRRPPSKRKKATDKRATAESPNAKRTSSRRTRRRSLADSASDLQVIYIHGIGAHPPVQQWKEHWDLSLFGRFMEEKTIPAYWADILHVPLAPNAWSKSAITDDNEVDLDATSILDSVGLDPENRENLEFVNGLLDSVQPFGGEADATGARRQRTRVSPFPKMIRQPIARTVMRWFLGDVAAYLLDAKIRQKIQERLISCIPRSGEPFVLVSHSLGTVIAFDVLSELTANERAEAELWVTLGSPLGIQEVQDELKKRNQLIVPSGIRAWHNFADPRDPVALDRVLGNDFDPNSDGTKVEDHEIRNPERRLLNPVSAHNSGGYLAHADVRRVVYHAAQYDWNSRFLVARDVAERFESGQRQPVLIEVLEPGYNALGETTEKLVDREESLAKQSKELNLNLNTMDGRAHILQQSVVEVVEENNPGATDSADVTKLRKYVSAKLTPEEIQQLTLEHAELNIFRVWRSAPKRALLRRSHIPLGVDAAGPTFKATGSKITWAVLDTGCNIEHPHFKDHKTVLGVYDCTKPGTDPNLIKVDDQARKDRNGHGTHVSGIIAGYGEGEEKQLYSGIAPDAKLIVYKVLNDSGEGEDAWIIKALDHIWSTNNNAFGLKIHGVNLSLGGPYDPTVFGCGYSPICTELRGLWRQGVVVCVAAGNEGQIQVRTADGPFDLNTALSIGDPANLEECIAVGSVHADKPHLYGISHFSSRGPTTDGRQKPDVVAPGEQIHSCNSRYNPTAKKPARRYVAYSGTSMACPHISGLIASFLSVRREFIGEPDKVKQILLKNCNDLHRHPHHQGAGIPNLVKMLVNT